MLSSIYLIYLPSLVTEIDAAKTSGTVNYQPVKLIKTDALSVAYISPTGYILPEVFSILS